MPLTNASNLLGREMEKYSNRTLKGCGLLLPLLAKPSKLWKSGRMELVLHLAGDPLSHQILTNQNVRKLLNVTHERETGWTPSQGSLGWLVVSKSASS